jgi:5'-3' exonuclease
MGIPSYFRRILQRYPGCLRSGPDAIKAEALAFDFNCLIYYCLRLMPPFEESNQSSWEQSLLHEINKTVKTIWNVAGCPEQVFLAVDGVVPMAKIRQQRMRRFKSAWLRQKGLDGRAGWDSNAITPGTKFMERLTISLRGLCATHKGWVVSGTDEKGEGEHKVMQWIRQKKGNGSVIVYGLDADLILLSMLTGEQTGRKLWLMREKQEFGHKGSSAKEGGQEYQFMSLSEFQEKLGVKGEEQVLQYIALMNLMGNDFLPHSITHKLNDDGHEYVLKELRAGVSLVQPNGNLNTKVFQEVCKRWSLDEADKMAHMIKKKKEQAKRGVLVGMSEEEGLPLKWFVEKSLFTQGQGQGQDDRNPILLEDWRQVYWSTWIRRERQSLCEEYMKGFQWILNYYRGGIVDLLWTFPSALPPLWSDLAACRIEEIEEAKEIHSEILPKEQLAMVLPLESWHLIQDPVLKGVPGKAPQYWPEEFEFFSAGRKWLWECEAIIPPLPIQRLRQIVHDFSV